ncbi:hypothetical protein ACFSTD_14890 [Novosphingobium colocasiae]
MTIRFAAARGTYSPAVRHALCPSAPLSAINDNQAEAGTLATRARGFADERSLARALRHFFPATACPPPPAPATQHSPRM